MDDTGIPDIPAMVAPAPDPVPWRQLPVAFEDLHAGKAFNGRARKDDPQRMVEAVFAVEAERDGRTALQAVFVAPPARGQEVAASSLATALDGMNRRRRAAGLDEMPRSVADAMSEKLMQQDADPDKHAHKNSYEAVVGGALETFSLVYLSPEVAQERGDMLALETLSANVPYDMLAFTRDVLSDAPFAALHELTHAALRDKKKHFTATVKQEGTADATALTNMAEYGGFDIAGKGLDKGLWRALLVHHSGHSLAFDAVLKARHDFLSDPDMIQRLPAGLAARGAELRKRIFEAGPEGSITHFPEVHNATEYARDVLSGTPCQVPENITRNSAVVLLVTQMAVERKTPLGVDNHLTRLMPELWKKSPVAFAQAQEYMQEEYGIEVHAPHRMEQGMKAGMKAHEASRMAGPAPGRK